MPGVTGRRQLFQGTQNADGDRTGGLARQRRIQCQKVELFFVGRESGTMGLAFDKNKTPRHIEIAVRNIGKVARLVARGQNASADRGFDCLLLACSPR